MLFRSVSQSRYAKIDAWVNDVLSYRKRVQRRMGTEASGEKSGGGVYLGQLPDLNAPNIQPPVTQPIKMPNIDVEPKSLATYKFEFGGKQFELQGDSSQKNMIDEFFREIEQAKKRT